MAQRVKYLASSLQRPGSLLWLGVHPLPREYLQAVVQARERERERGRERRKEGRKEGRQAWYNNRSGG